MYILVRKFPPITKTSNLIRTYFIPLYTFQQTFYCTGNYLGITCKAVACLATVGVPVRPERNIEARDGVFRIWAARKNAANAIHAARRVRREQKRGSGLSPHFSRGPIFRIVRLEWERLLRRLVKRMQTC